MKRNIVATAAAAGLAAAVVGLAAPALATPSEDGNAQETIGQLQGGGNKVVVNKLGGAPLSEADVVAIRTGGYVRQWVWDSHDDRLELRVTGQIYYVDVR